MSVINTDEDLMGKRVHHKISHNERDRWFLWTVTSVEGWDEEGTVNFNIKYDGWQGEYTFPLMVDIDCGDLVLLSVIGSDFECKRISQMWEDGGVSHWWSRGQKCVNVMIMWGSMLFVLMRCGVEVKMTLPMMAFLSKCPSCTYG